MASKQELQIVVSAKDEASNELGKVHKSLVNFDAVGKIAKGALLGVGAAALGIGVAIFKASEDANNAFTAMRASTGATGEEMTKLKSLAVDLQRSNVNSIGEITEALGTMKKAWGVNADEARGLSQQVFDFAKVTGQSAVGAIEALDDVMDTWGASAEDMVGVMDNLNTVNQQTGASVSEMQAALAAQATSLQALGVDMNEAITLYGNFAQAGLSANDATIALNTALQKVKTPEEFQKMVDKIYSMEDPIEQVNAAVDLFGAKAGPKLVPLIKDGLLSLETLSDGFTNIEGSVKRASAAMDMTIGVQLDLLKNKALALGMSLGIDLPVNFATMLASINDVMPTIEEFQSMLSDLRSRFTNAMNEFEKSTGILSLVRDGFAEIWQKIQLELGPALAELWEAFQPFLPYLQELAVVFLQFAGVALKQTIEGLITLIKFLVDVGTVVTKLSAAFLTVLKPTLDIIRATIEALYVPIEKAISAFNAMRAAAMAAYNAASSAVGGAIGSITGRASGGPVQAGVPYIVGEKRPELFVPNQSGTIIPYVPSLGGGGASTVNVQVMQGATISLTNEADENRLTQRIVSEITRALQGQRNGLSTSI